MNNTNLGVRICVGLDYIPFNCRGLDFYILLTLLNSGLLLFNGGIEIFTSCWVIFDLYFVRINLGLIVRYVLVLTYDTILCLRDYSVGWLFL